MQISCEACLHFIFSARMLAKIAGITLKKAKNYSVLLKDFSPIVLLSHDFMLPLHT